MNNLWKGIAIVGIWIGLGLSAPYAGTAIYVGYIVAGIGTVIIASCTN